MWPFSKIADLELELAELKVYARKVLASASTANQQLRRANLRVSILEARLKSKNLSTDIPELDAQND